MRYPTILGAAVLASAALVAAPAMVKSQTVKEKVEQKAEQAWQKTKDVTHDAKAGAQQKAADVWAKTKSTGRAAKTATRDSYEPAVSPHGEMTAPKPAQVMAMQQALTDKGYAPGPIDGVMGRRTASALKKYQQTENLNVTGQMDAETAAKLKI